MSRSTAHLAAIGAVLVASVVGCTPADTDRWGEALRTATPPATATQAVDTIQSGQQLAGLRIAPEGPATGYDRDLFPHWSTTGGRCDTREVVLREQGADVRADEDCHPTSGTWASPYDGSTWTRASDVDVDHMVPLAEAWESGAAAWSTTRREEFANDLGPRGDGYPQLVAVTDNENARKGQRDPAEYRPPLRSHWCAYASMWIAVKDAYGLAADPAEVDAVDQMLDTCGTGGAK